MQMISDNEYRAAEQAFRDRLADRIKASGISASELARDTRIDRRTIVRALRAQAGVRADAMARIDYRLDRLNETQSNCKKDKDHAVQLGR